jgi:hypothetical protein
VIQAARHYPGFGALHIEKGSLRLPPVVIRTAKARQSSGAVFRIQPDELEPAFLVRKRRGIHIHTQHGAEPHSLAHALMHHVFVHAASARIVRVRPHWQVLVLELAPHAQDFDAFGLVALDEKIVFHDEHPVRRNLADANPAHR